ncbi:MAG: hypothetical protein QW753_01405 [Thermofilum sp.]
MTIAVKRVFVLHSNTGVTAPTFTEASLATEGGRMDVVARSLISALYDTGRPRRDTLFIAVLHGPPTPPLAIYLRPWLQAERKPSEREAGAHLLRVLKGAKAHASEVKREETIEAVRSLKKLGYRIHLMLERGDDIRGVRLEEGNVFVLGDHIGFPEEVQEELESECDEVISLGKVSYLASHCILYLHEILDRFERFERYRAPST